MNDDILRRVIEFLGNDDVVEIVSVPGQPNARALQAKTPGEGVCDFCSDRPCYANYDVESIEVFAPIDKPYVPTVISEGAWSACKICAEMIDRLDRRSLVIRSITRMREKHGHNIPIKLGDIKVIHDAFWAAYEG